MYRRLDGAAGNLVGYELTGKLTRAEYAALAGELEELIDAVGRVRLLTVIHDLEGVEPGVLIDDLAFAFRHLRDIERWALVGDASWQRWSAKVADAVTPTEGRYFERDREREAWDWLREGAEAGRS